MRARDSTHVCLPCVYCECAVCFSLLSSSHRPAGHPSRHDATSAPILPASRRHACSQRTRVWARPRTPPGDFVAPAAPRLLLLLLLLLLRPEAHFSRRHLARLPLALDHAGMCVAHVIVNASRWSACPPPCSGQRLARPIFDQRRQPAFQMHRALHPAASSFQLQHKD